MTATARMRQKVASGQAIDISGCRRTVHGDYVLDTFEAGKDYCDLQEGRWVWSIGRNKATGEIIACLTDRLYQIASHECLWLR